MDNLQAAVGVAKIEIDHIDGELSPLIAAGKGSETRALNLRTQRARLVQALHEAEEGIRRIKSEELQRKMDSG